MADDQQPLLHDQLLPNAKQGEHYQSLASMSDEEVFAAPQASVTSGFPGIPAVATGMAAQGIRRPAMQISGVADPAFANNKFQIGDKVYSSKMKCEGEVLDISAAGRVQIRPTTGKNKGNIGWTDSSQCVKI